MLMFKPRVSLFEKVMAQIADAVVRGEFAPGDKLPSLRDLGAHFGVSLVTVQRAVRELEKEEWLVALPRKGVVIADPLPPVAHLMRLKSSARAKDTLARGGHDSIPAGRNGTLKCLIYDEALLPLFEWAAREYADAYAPYALRFEFQSLLGHDDEESLRSMDADMALLPSQAINRAARLGAITPAEGMLRANGRHFADVSAGLLDLVSHAGHLWAVPLMASGAILTAQDELCSRVGIKPEELTSVDATLTAIETAVSTNGHDPAPGLFNITFVLVLLILAGHPMPPIGDVPSTFADPAIRSLLERLRALARHAAVVPTRFDQWSQIDLSSLAIRHQPSGLFCHDTVNRTGARVLSVLKNGSGTAPLAVHGLCIGARSLHPYEAWEWAARLTEVPFQRRLAELAYEIPVNLNPEVAAAFARSVGETNASALLDMVRRPSRLYGLGPEDIMRYLWEVLSNELYRFVTGMNDYAQMRERVATKTERYLVLYGPAQQGGTRFGIVNREG